MCLSVCRSHTHTHTHTHSLSLSLFFFCLWFLGSTINQSKISLEQRQQQRQTTCCQHTSQHPADLKEKQKYSRAQRVQEKKKEKERANRRKQLLAKALNRVSFTPPHLQPTNKLVKRAVCATQNTKTHHEADIPHPATQTHGSCFLCPAVVGEGVIEV